MEFMGVGLGGTYSMMCDVQEHEFHRRYSDFRKWKYVDRNSGNVLIIFLFTKI